MVPIRTVQRLILYCRCNRASKQAVTDTENMYLQEVKKAGKTTVINDQGEHLCHVKDWPGRAHKTWTEYKTHLEQLQSNVTDGFKCYVYIRQPADIWNALATHTAYAQQEHVAFSNDKCIAFIKDCFE